MDNDSLRFVGQIRAYIDRYGINSAIGMVAEAIEQDDEEDFETVPEYDLTEFHKNRELAKEVLDEVYGALNINYQIAAVADRKQAIEYLIGRLGKKIESIT